MGASLLALATIGLYISIIVCDSNICGNDDCVESKPLYILFMFCCMKKYQTVVFK